MWATRLSSAFTRRRSASAWARIWFSVASLIFCQLMMVKKMTRTTAAAAVITRGGGAPNQAARKGTASRYSIGGVREETSIDFERGELIIEKSIRAGSIRAAQTPPSGPPISHIGIDRLPNSEALANRLRQAVTRPHRGIFPSPSRFTRAKASSSRPCIRP